MRVCGSDLWPYRGIEPADHQVMGHEYVGVVEQVGADVKTVQVGDFVVGSFVISDNTCEICQAGYQSRCVQGSQLPRFGSTLEPMAILARSEPLFDEVLIRPAQPGEEDIVLDLLAEAAAWLHGRGIAQWPPRFPTSSVQAQIAVGEALLVEEAHHPIATLAVAEDDTELWGSDTAPAYYISRLAVARRAGGAGLGHRIIDWVAGKAAERGWQHVRLATASDNPALRHYYERAGFEHVADPPHARWPTSLYERVTALGGRSQVGTVR